MSEASLAPGHNRAPFDLSVVLDTDLLRGRLDDEFGHKLKRRDDLLAGVGRFHAATAGGIADEETQARATDFVKQIKSEIKQIEGLRDGAKRPVLDAGRLIDTYFRASLADPLAKAARGIEDKMTAYARHIAEVRRRQAEEAARQQAEEAARQAAAARASDDDTTAEAAAEAERAAAEKAIAATSTSRADLSRTYGDMGAVASLTGRWAYRVTDENKVPRRFLMPNDAAIRAAMKAATRDGVCSAQIAGIEIYRDERVVVR